MEKITKLAIFDFDGTLVNTPLPDKGRIEYEKKTGQPWPHKGWWGQPDSLDTKVFDMPVIDSVISDYKTEKTNPNTLTILLTGRIKKLSTYVEKVLKEKGLSFDEYHYNNGGSTDAFKVKILDDLIRKYPDVEVEMWEDRLEHVPIFEQWGKEKALSGEIKDFKINVVFTGHH